MRISDWSSDVCSSDLPARAGHFSRRHVADRLFGLSGLPRQYPQGPASSTKPGRRSTPGFGNPADVAGQGRYLGACAATGWHGVGGTIDFGNAQLLPEPTRYPAHLGLRLRPLPSLHATPARPPTMNYTAQPPQTHTT